MITIAPLLAAHYPRVREIYLAALIAQSEAGFRVVGTRERIGQLHGLWRDVLFLERRRPD